MRKTKIICTLGPASDSDAVLERLIQEGMDVARFNFSHGTHEEQKKRLTKLRLLRERYGRPVATLLDTKGPEIRVRDFKDGAITLQKGDEFVLTGREVEGDEHIVTITYPELVSDVKVGQRILIDDGLIEMTVKELTDTDIICDVNNGGKVSNHKGINVPGIHLSLPYISEVDKSDLLFGIEEDVDYVAASFVRTAEDVLQIRRLLQENGGEQIKIIAKIENREGVNCIDEIIEVSDAIMIARGDMGVEIPTEEVPVIQKMIIKKVYEAGKQVITATQMMVRIANRTESDIDYRKRFFQRSRKADPDVTDAICHATCTTAHDINAKAIITVTKSGRSARMISKYRPACDIIGCAITDKVYRQLNLSWGVTPVLLQEKKDVFELFEHGTCVSRRMGLVDSGDTVVCTSGVPVGISGTTNMIKVQTVI